MRHMCLCLYLCMSLCVVFVFVFAPCFVVSVKTIVHGSVCFQRELQNWKSCSFFQLPDILSFPHLPIKNYNRFFHIPCGDKVGAGVSDFRQNTSFNFTLILFWDIY